ILVAGKAARALVLERSLLTLHNPVFHFTDSGREAMDLILQNRPRLAVLSEGLDDMPGEEVAHQVRDHAELRSTSIMLLDDSSNRVQSSGVTNAPTSEDEEMDRESLVMLADRLLTVSPRAAASASVCIGTHHDGGKQQAMYAQSLNISESGMLLETREPLL